MPMHLKRATLAENIVVEFFPSKKDTGRVVILCDGMPSVPGKKRVVQWFAKQGFFTMNLRYRGTWESGGTFLDHDPIEDIRDLITSFDKPFTDAWSGEEHQLNAKEVFVVGASFGGTAALLSSLDDRIKKIIALAPVIDWTITSEAEPMEWLEQVIRNGYMDAYRFEHQDWLRLSKGQLFQPITHKDTFDPDKIFMIHAQDDTVVPITPAQEFARHIGCKMQVLKKGGHLGSGALTTWRLRKKILHFLNT
jgi:alpha-beta hydrolase superfamily lysophospholipase